MKIEESVKHIDKYIHDEKVWGEIGFSYGKAFVCAVMSNLAYCHISQYELDNTTNVNLIPSDSFAESLLGLNSQIILNQLLNVTGTEDPIIIERPGSIVVAVKYEKLVFISIRGTEFKNIHDWRINLNSKKLEPELAVKSNALLHKGFYLEVVSFHDELINKIKNKEWDDCDIYVTGHSLGGALAAIFSSINKHRLMYSPRPWIHYNTLKINSCYTYGMPRWGNDQAIALLDSPYHIFVNNDIVPNLPPKILGFESCVKNYSLDDNSFSYVNYFGERSYLNGVLDILTKKKLKDHKIENYVERIFQRCNNGR